MSKVPCDHSRITTAYCPDCGVAVTPMGVRGELHAYVARQLHLAQINLKGATDRSQTPPPVGNWDHRPRELKSLPRLTGHIQRWQRWLEWLSRVEGTS